MESTTDILAQERGMDPLVLRLRNAQEPGETTAQGVVLEVCGLWNCLTLAGEGLAL